MLCIYWQADHVALDGHQFCLVLTAVAHIHTATTMSTSSQVKNSKKRKHVEASDSSGRRREPKTAAFIVSNDNSRDGLKPLIASTPSIALTDDTELTLYESSAASGSKDGKKDKGKGRVVASMLHGESAKLEWTSTNRMAPESVPWRTSGEDVLAGQDIADNTAEECSASYALALYDPATSSISMIDAPLHILSHIPKRLKNLAAISSREPGSNNFMARTELGLTFGTKKAQKAIKAAERNKVDAGAQDLQVLQDVMQQGLTEGLETLPESSKVPGGPPKEGQDLEAGPAVVEAARLAGRPVPDLAAETPEDVYQIFGSIILTKEYDAITVHPLLSVDAGTPQKACVMLPFKRSTWVNDRVKDLVANRNGKYKDKERVLKLKVLVWISTLMAMRTSRGGIDPTNADAVGRQFGRLVGSEAIQSLLERFTENIRGTKK